ncbi:MAG: hypothetical protein CSA52_01655 [Gammaproteobacteria bacterium]|nr:MAG: hypothetical protein CSB48_02960 [Pseudomonadota bacterium]PIE38617.1 MAG: hypothetical protein CSA52_01655 [Gammaproteobacteria bacterium]
MSETEDIGMLISIRSITVFLLSLSVVLLAGCKAQQIKEEVPSKVPVQVNLLKKWSNCRFFEKKVHAEVVEEVDLSSLLLVGSSKKNIKIPAGQKGVLVYLGMKPSLGYSVKVSGQGSYVLANELFLAIDQAAPELGKMVAQMLSYPCGLLTVPDKGYDKITLVGPLRGLPASIEMP